MKCPYCQDSIPENWLPLYAIHDYSGKPLVEPAPAVGYIVDEKEAANAICADAGVSVPHDKSLGESVGLHMKAGWMRCPNPKCRQLLAYVVRRVYNPFGSGRSVILGKTEDLFVEETIVFPRRPAPRPVDPLVADMYAEPFKQACLILDDSPGMSAVLSRKILADLLEREGGYTGYTIKEQIDKFIDDAKRPSTVKENLHYLREMADFAAHTKADLTTGEILETTHEEAEWTLTNVESLFDHFIVGPERDKARRDEMAAKMARAGRKPIPPFDQGKGSR